MSDNFHNFHNGINLEPLSSDPSNPKEGDLHISDGTARTAGLWQYLSSAWVLFSAGSTILSIVSKSTTYTATTSDEVILVDTGIAWTLTLYASASNSGKKIIIKKTTSDTNSLTIDANSTETIDGSTTLILDLQYEEVTLICDGSNWYIEDHFVPLVALRRTSATTAAEANPLDFTTAVYDTHSGYSSGVYTTPKAGKYAVSSRILTASKAWTAGNAINLTIEKGGVSYAASDDRTPTMTDQFGASIFTIVDCAKGETLELGFSSSGSATLSGVAVNNYLEIYRIGS
jgi:hypothetical protein